ncbi:MAG: hypothetical protein QME63_07960, partial [Actinomycetota bacterium]|nr:hypothetical protein [Actinomycetota bacterium]
ELRIFPKKQSELWDEGFDKEEGKYIGAKWGKYLRAPDIFFKILEKGKGKLVPLKEVADVRFGIKTGANEFFYLTEEEIKRWGIEKEFWMHKDEKGNWVPNYVVRSPRECKSIRIDARYLEYRVLIIHKDKKQLKGTRVLKYIEWGEDRGFHQRPTCASRKPWYKLEQKPAVILWFKAFNDRFISPLNISGVFSSDRFYAVYPNNVTTILSLTAILNASLCDLFVELWGRVPLGEGALDNMRYEVASMLIINPDSVTYNKQALQNILKGMVDRPIKSVFEEIGADSPEEVELSKVKPDRRALDQIIMGEILGLTDEEQLEVYKAVVDLVRSRIERAKSVSNKTRTKEGIDIEALASTVLEKIGPETLGLFYKTKIQSQKTYAKALPEKAKDIKIEQTLMGWRLISGKNSIDCSSEELARYLKVWLEAGLSEVQVPLNDNYLKLILSELESLHETIKKTIDNYLYSIVDQKTRKKVEQKLWQEVTKI